MRLALISVIVAGMVTILSYGGPGGCGGAASDNPPNVAGSYSCTSGCTGTCTMTDLTVTQTGSNVIAVTEVSTCTGDINNDGDYSGDCEGENGSELGNCSGTFAGGVFTADCIINGIDCQRATYTED